MNISVGYEVEFVYYPNGHCQWNDYTPQELVVVDGRGVSLYDENTRTLPQMDPNYFFARPFRSLRETWVALVALVDSDNPWAMDAPPRMESPHAHHS